MGSVPSSWRMRTGLGAEEESLTAALERWAELTYTEQVGGGVSSKPLDEQSASICSEAAK